MFDSVVKIDVLDDGVIVSAGHGEQLILPDFEAFQIPLREVAILVIGAESAGFELVAVWDIEDAEQVYAKFLGVDDAGDKVAAFHDEAYALATGAGEAGFDNWAEEIGLGDGTLDNVFLRVQCGRVQEFVGIECVPAQESGVFFGEVGIDSGTEEAGADVVG